MSTPSPRGSTDANDDEDGSNDRSSNENDNDNESNLEDDADDDNENNRSEAQLTDRETYRPTPSNNSAALLRHLQQQEKGPSLLELESPHLASRGAGMHANIPRSGVTVPPTLFPPAPRSDQPQPGRRGRLMRLLQAAIDIADQHPIDDDAGSDAGGPDERPRTYPGNRHQNNPKTK